MPSDVPAVEAIGVTRVHGSDGTAVTALKGVSLRVGRGEVVAIVGPSGSGKSTLLFLLGGLDRPDEGTVNVVGTDWETLAGSDRARFRRLNCGFVIQGMALLPQATAAENVEVPLVLDGVESSERTSRVTEALERVGLRGEAGKLPDQLSGGQQQRVAIARALVTAPALVLADEPTGNLDFRTGESIMGLIEDLHRSRRLTSIHVTHNLQFARRADRVLRLEKGRLIPASFSSDPSFGDVLDV
jgi:ABC-type lipoprotein export system ATPase subunit